MEVSPTLLDMPTEVLERILTFLQRLQDIANASAATRIFRGGKGGRSPVEQALRERAKARGHSSALPHSLPPFAASWVEELFAREAVFRVATEHAFVAVAGGPSYAPFSAFVDVHGGLHTCGERYSADDEQYVSPMAIGHPDWCDVATLVPRPVASLSAVSIRAVAAGLHHLLALSEAGGVYACGDNSSGQLGLGHDEGRSTFSHVSALRSELVVHVAAGAAHSHALCADGRVHSWGSNSSGQLGLGPSNTRSELSPCRVEALERVRVAAVAAGGHHTLLLSAGGAVYSCGMGNEGRLGHGDEQHQWTPRRIEALLDVRATHVSAGFTHSLVLDAAGGVHSFGAGAFGCLGHGDLDDRHLPRHMEALAGARAERASAGYTASTVVCADGSVYICGRDGWSQPTQGLAPIIWTPVRLVALEGERVVGCSSGLPGHALFVTADGGVYSCGAASGALGRGVSLASRSAEPSPVRILSLPRARHHRRADA